MWTKSQYTNIKGHIINMNYMTVQLDIELPITFSALVISMVYPKLIAIVRDIEVQKHLLEQK